MNIYNFNATIKKTLRSVCLCSSLAFGLSASAQTFSGFGSGSEGWQVADIQDFGPYTSVLSYSGPQWFSTGGKPGGYIGSPDPSGNTFWFSAPSSFTGNQSGVYGGTLSYQLQTPNPGGSSPYAPDGEGDVVLVSPSFTLVAKDGAVPDLVDWTKISVSLSTAGGWHVDSVDGRIATGAEIQQTLGGLTSLFIRGEYQLGDDAAGLDSVQMSAVPEPQAYAAAAGGLLFGVAVWRRLRLKQGEAMPSVVLAMHR